MQNKILFTLREELKQNSEQKIKDSAKRFFKEEVKFYGIKTPVVIKIAKKYFQEIKNWEKEKIFALCEELLKTDFSEEAFIAFDWIYSIRKKYQPNDFTIFENWINKYINNWAKCDTFCNHTVGTFIEIYPRYISNLKAWAKSPNRWMRRASAVSLIVPAKKGLFFKEILEIADILLTDNDDLVQKGYGWMLKAACNQKEKEVFDYVMEKKKNMPRTALRYAIEKMSNEMKLEAMKK